LVKTGNDRRLGTSGPYLWIISERKYSARTTVVVGELPDPEFLLEIECEAVPE